MLRRTLLLSLACAATAAVAAGPAMAASRQFQSPTGNIACWIEGGTSVRCEITQRDWSPPPKPRACRLDWGQGLVLGARNRPGFLCAGDTIQPPPSDPYPVLRYGRSLRVGSITCTSARTGVTCTNRARHGFTLSRQRYRLF
ncbi:MAG: DUF6636 domain-containing protein [Actinomycetota bacterium]